MHVLFLTDSYPPEIRSASHLIYELANGLVARRHQITVATAMPRYNLAKDKKVDKYRTVTNESGIKVIRLNVLPLHKNAYFLRGLSHLLLPFIFYRGVRKFISGKPDVVIVYSPPLTLGVTGAWLKNHFSSKTILNIQDIFPQNAIDLNIISNRLVVNFFEKLEKWIYERIDVLAVHSEGNKKFLIEKKELSSNKAMVVHNWIHRDNSNKNKPTDFRKLYNVDSKTTILFAGIIGPAQGLDIAINIAQRLRNEEKIHFIFVGEGTEKEKLKQKKKKLNLSNISFHPFVSRENYQSLLGAADIGLVCLSALNRTPVVPGKLINYMAAGLPVLAILNRESDGHKIIEEARCGFSFFPEEEEKIVDAMLKLEDNELREAMGRRGADFAIKYFSLNGAMDKYEEIFENVC